MRKVAALLISISMAMNCFALAPTSKFMDNDEKKLGVFLSCFSSYQSVVDAINYGLFSAIIPERAVKASDFDEITLDKNKSIKIFNLLVRIGYVAKDGRIRSAFKRVALSGYTNGEGFCEKNKLPISAETYNILISRLSFGDAWKILKGIDVSTTAPIHKTAANHILQTIKNVDEIVAEMVLRRKISGSYADKFKERLRRIMLFHDYGKAMDNSDLFAKERRHANISAKKYSEVFDVFWWFPRSIVDEDMWIIERHGMIGVLPQNDINETESGEQVYSFILGMAENPGKMRMLEAVTFCDILNRDSFLSCAIHVESVKELCELIYICSLEEKNSFDDLMKNLIDRRNISIALDEIISGLNMSVDWRIAKKIKHHLFLMFARTDEKTHSVDIENVKKIAMAA